MINNNNWWSTDNIQKEIGQSKEHYFSLTAIRNINSVENAIQPQLFILPFGKNWTPIQSILWLLYRSPQGKFKLGTKMPGNGFTHSLRLYQFIELRVSIFYKRKFIKVSIIIEFMKKSKVYERKPKLNKRDLSPDRNIKDTRKRHSKKETETEKRPKKKPKTHQTSILNFKKIN